MIMKEKAEAEKKKLSKTPLDLEDLRRSVL